MADNHSKDQRSYNMSRIRSKDNKPEDLVRKYLFSKGFRYRKNVRKLPGCPDIVLPKYKAVVSGISMIALDLCGRRLIKIIGFPK